MEETVTPSLAPDREVKNMSQCLACGNVPETEVLNLANVCEGSIDEEFQRCYKEALAAGGGKIAINFDITKVEGTNTMAKIKGSIKCALPARQKAAMYQFDSSFAISVENPEEERELHIAPQTASPKYNLEV